MKVKIKMIPQWIHVTLCSPSSLKVVLLFFFIHLYFWSYRSYLADRNIRVGATNRAVAEVTQRQYEIKRVIKVKENFLQYGPGDITLFELNETVQFTPYIQPICLPEPDEKFSETSICYATGWGYTTPGGKYLIHHFKTVIKVHFRFSLTWHGGFFLSVSKGTTV